MRTPHAVELDQQLRLAGEAALADEAVAVPLVCRAEGGRAVDAEERRHGARVEPGGAPDRIGGGARQEAPVRAGRSRAPRRRGGTRARCRRPSARVASISATASRSLVVSASSVTISPSSGAISSARRKPRSNARPGPWFVAEPDHLDRQRSRVRARRPPPCRRRIRRRRRSGGRLATAPGVTRGRRCSRGRFWLLVVGRHHEDVHQYAPRRARTTGIVWQRILMSHQSDQLVT